MTTAPANTDKRSRPESQPILAPDVAIPFRREPVFGIVRRLRETPPRYLYGTTIGLAAYLGAMRLGLGGFHDEQICFSLLFVLAFWSDGTRRFLSGVLPLILFLIVYDLTHLTQPLFRYLTIHVGEPYAFDRRYFGIQTARGLLTPNEFFGRHHWPAVDFFTGLSYILFVYWAFAFGIYMACFRRGERDRKLLLRFGWTFLAMNVAGFATYYIYPAAPPWYVTIYGLGPVHMEACASAARAARWDALTGIPYFAMFYGHSADVFGAIPSLHPTYPLLTYLYGRELRKRWLDVASLALFAVVAFGAVYLNHHYVRDVLLGVLYTLAAWGIERLLRRRSSATVANAASGGMAFRERSSW